MLTVRNLLACAGFTTLAACSQAAASTPANVLADDIGNVNTLAASDGYLYWVRLDAADTNSWSIERMAETGGAVDVVAANIAEPGGLAVDGTSVYWTDVAGGRLLAAPLSGVAAGGTPTVIASNLTSPLGIVVVDGAAYVNETTSLFDSSMVRIPFDGGAPKTIASGFMQPATNEGSTLYFAHVNALSCAAAPCALSTIYRYATGDASPTALFTSPEIVQSIAVRDGNIYTVSESADPSALYDVSQTPLAGGSPTTIASGLTNAEGLVATPGSLYWMVRGVVWTAPTDGGKATQVSDDLVSSIASDGSALFAIGYTPRGAAIFEE